MKLWIHKNRKFQKKIDEEAIQDCFNTNNNAQFVLYLTDLGILNKTIMKKEESMIK